MLENYEIKSFASPAFGPDSLGDPLKIKPKDEKWKQFFRCNENRIPEEY